MAGSRVGFVFTIVHCAGDGERGRGCGSFAGVVHQDKVTAGGAEWRKCVRLND